MGNMIRDYCIQRTIRKGKEDKIYRMLVEVNSLVESDKLKGLKLLKRAGRIIERDIYNFDSRRTLDEFATAELVYLGEKVE